MKKFIAVILMFAVFSWLMPLNSYAAKKQKTKEQTVFDYANIEWWHGFDDPLLTDYVVKALNYNHDLKVSTLKIEETTENKNLVRANELPNIGIGAVPVLYKLPFTTKTQGLLSFPAYTNFELDIFGKNRDKTKSMDKMVDISRQNERATSIAVASAVGSAYYNVVKLDKLIELQKKIADDREQIYNLMKLSNEEGLISTADTTNAHKAYIKANSDLIELEKTRERLLNMLAVLIGENPENSIAYQTIVYADLVINKPIPDSINSEVIINRPDYISAEKMVEKTGLDVRAAKKEFLPTIDILGLLSFNTSKKASNFSWNSSIAALGGGMLLPLYTGGRRIANLKLQKNKYKQAIENYENTNLKSIQEVNNALCDLKLDNEKYLKTLEIFNAEKQDFHYTELKYKEGIISKLDLLQKTESLLVTEKTEVNDKTNYFIDQIALYKATAGGKF